MHQASADRLETFISDLALIHRHRKLPQLLEVINGLGKLDAPVVLLDLRLPPPKIQLLDLVVALNGLSKLVQRGVG